MSPVGADGTSGRRLCSPSWWEPSLSPAAVPQRRLAPPRASCLRTTPGSKAPRPPYTCGCDSAAPSHLLRCQNSERGSPGAIPGRRAPGRASDPGGLPGLTPSAWHPWPHPPSGRPQPHSHRPPSPAPSRGQRPPRSPAGRCGDISLRSPQPPPGLRGPKLRGSWDTAVAAPGPLRPPHLRHRGLPHQPPPPRPRSLPETPLCSHPLLLATPCPRLPAWNPLSSPPHASTRFLVGLRGTASLRRRSRCVHGNETCQPRPREATCSAGHASCRDVRDGRQGAHPRGHLRGRDRAEGPGEALVTVRDRLPPGLGGEIPS